MTISEQLREAIAVSGETHYRIWKETGIRPQVLGRWMSGEREHLRTDTVDTLAEYFGLELKPKKRKQKAKGK